MKERLLFILLMAISLTPLWSQQTVKGNITDAKDGTPLIGVSIMNVDSKTGTITDIEGNYEISVPANATLKFSYTGYADQSIAVGTQTEINVKMAAGLLLDEVVVTSLGMKRSKKALGYSVTEVDGSSFQEARENNIANSLAGKIAGVNVSSIASGPAGSSRVIIRGSTSLTGGNQPLYVIDGIPIDNSGFGQAGMWGGTDGGDGTSSINPDDIENITVLKGANAAALYGSRASNGVILVTTKSGKARKGIGVEFSSNLVFEKFNNFYDFQEEYGQGSRGRRPASGLDAWDIGTSNWGEKYDGAPTPQFDGVDRPYSYAGNNFDRFYQTGTTFTNSLAFSGGSENQRVRFNFSNLDNKGIIPNAGFNRRNVSLSYNGKYGEKLTVSSKILYSNEKAAHRPRVADSPGNAAEAIARLPGNVNVEDLSGDIDKPGAIPTGVTTFDSKATGEELQLSPDLWNTNPYWAASAFNNSDTRDRIISANTAKFDITDFLYVQGRVGVDWFTRRAREVEPYGTGFRRTGTVSEEERRVRETNLEAIIGLDKNIGDISLNVFVGGNQMRRSLDRLRVSGSVFKIPFFPTLANLTNRNGEIQQSDEGINSVFGSASVGFKSMVYLTATARNDWFSTLNPETNSILYPSIGGSFVFSELMDVNKGLLTFGKLRASWAQVGGDTDPYRLLLSYGLGQGHTGVTTASINQNSIPNNELKPLTSTEFEIGADLRFLKNRLGVDITYYAQNTVDDILDATVSVTSGFGGTTLNIGQLKNNGIELLVTGSPIRKRDFSWDAGFNFSINNSEVVSLSEGITSIKIGEPRTRVAFINQIVGEGFGAITGFTQMMIDGQPVFDSESGAPIRSTETSIIGNGVHKFVGGLTNNLNFKGIYLDFLIDFKAGGDLYSGTNVRLTGRGGKHKQTVEAHSGIGYVSEGREKLTVTGVDAEGNPLTKTLDETEIPEFWSKYSELSDRFVYDASFVKFRQLSLGYNLPSKLLENTPVQSASLSIVGRNLFVLFTNVENVDPESNYGNTNAQGFDYFGQPTTRTFGFNLKVGF